MLETFKVLEEIEKARGTIKKMQLLQLLQNNKFARFYFDTAFNSYLNYGISKIKDAGRTYPTPTQHQLLDLRVALVKRHITGAMAKAAMEISISTSDPLINKWLKAMWQKDLKIGLSSISINKVFGGMIPKFELQACASLKKGKEIEGSWIVEPKYDGLRAVIVFENGNCKGVLSRSGRELFNMENIIEELKGIGLKDGVLDGEVYGKDWNETISIVKASRGSRDSDKIKFFAFDYIPLEEWNENRGVTRLEDRKATLYHLINVMGGDRLTSTVEVPYFGIGSSDEAWSWAKKFLDQGYEGSVIKNMDSVYEFKRSKNWLKLKFEETYDLEIVGFQKGSGKNKNRLGAFICKGFKGEEVNVGGGFSDLQREELWKEAKSYVGKIMEVKCQEKTKDGSLRFPVFVRMRDDK